ncbi:LLGL2 protein [Opisthorchis viverrini]|uniref:LLGL2 protein n=1 Tax=Opisthorchis viverrini TaxID=6198 RepID=A0A1S8WGE5_OPIVI|nr:LLGL2 protein [Opisthorchis viverrini]
MAQRLLQSFRRIPGHLASFRKKPEPIEAHGSSYKINVVGFLYLLNLLKCADYGFPAKPTSIAYDPTLDLIALLTRDGNLYMYPFFQNSSSFSRKLITLTDSDDIYLWELTSTTQASVRLVQIACLREATSSLRSNSVNGVNHSDCIAVTDGSVHITSICCTSDGRSFLIGTDHGWVASVRLNLPSKSSIPSKDFEYLTLPTPEDSITPARILSNLSPTRHQRLRLDAVVVLSERPGFPGQLLIGYNSGLSLIFDLRADRIVALLQWKHHLEAATWCGGSGLPSRTAPPNASPVHLGMRLLTAHSDGSLGVWNLKDIGFTVVTSSPASEPPSLTMEEPPTMPYGPFPCKLISKVFWLPSPSGGITAFVGGMPRATYGERHTVSLLRGSNLDRAAAANLVAARIAAVVEADDDDDDLLDSNLAPSTPMHVFDPDAPEHVCFDLPSRLVDLLPVGPVGGPAQILLILCEEELVVVDLFTPGWPFMRPPYLTCLHTANITAHSLVTQVNPNLLAQLEAAGVYYGPEGRFGRGSAVLSSPNSAGWSHRQWPIQGGQALVNGSRLSSSSIDDNLLFTDDLLLTGHEDGSVVFWRLSPGGCARRIYTLHTCVLFEGEFGLVSHASDLDEDADSWPPFRQAGVFDPFMDDSRAAVQVVRLVGNTLAVGGAAGQLRAGVELGAILGPQQTTKPPAQLQPIGVILAQPPARCTALSFSEIRQQTSAAKPQNPLSSPNPGVMVAVGTPHGYGVVYLPPPNVPPSEPSTPWKAGPTQLLIAESTLPDNYEALQEAAAGEGWARRRTRELKKSLRDSFRRLKRMRSTKRATNEVPATTNLSRAGVRRTVTQNTRGIGRNIDSGPLEDAELRAIGMNDPPEFSSSGLPPVGIEREICDRPTDSASVAIVSYFVYGPPLFRFSSSSSASQTANQPIGSLFVGTKAGIVKAYALFADRSLQSSQPPTVFRMQLAKQLILQHRAPILNLRLVDGKSNHPLPSSALYFHSNLSNHATVPPNLLVVSEEQVRLFTLPALRLRFKARITAKDGYRIKAGTVVSFRISDRSRRGSVDKVGDDSAFGDLDRSGASTASTPNHFGTQGDLCWSEFSFVFTNVGGQAVVLSMPHLSRKDTFHVLDSNDVVAVSSVMFSEPGTVDFSHAQSVTAPSLGVYQLAPGQVTLFDVTRVGQRASLLGASYRPIHRIPNQPPGPMKPLPPPVPQIALPLNNGSTADSSGVSSRIFPLPHPKHSTFSVHTTTGCSTSYTGSQINSSMLSNTLSDSVRDCFSSPGSSFVSDQYVGE